MIERTLVLLKPDAVRRGLIGRILSRFEDAGYKIVGAKMVWVDKNICKEHYERIGKVISRRGKKVFNNLVKFMTIGPVLALCIEGVNAVENIRKMAGPTEPKSAMPGTIRGDFSHVSFSYADKKNKAIENVVHVSSSLDEARQEIALWFKPSELHSYKTVHEIHTL